MRWNNIYDIIWSNRYDNVSSAKYLPIFNGTFNWYFSHSPWVKWDIGIRKGIKDTLYHWKHNFRCIYILGVNKLESITVKRKSPFSRDALVQKLNLPQELSNKCHLEKQFLQYIFCLFNHFTCGINTLNRQK